MCVRGRLAARTTHGRTPAGLSSLHSKPQSLSDPPQATKVLLRVRARAEEGASRLRSRLARNHGRSVQLVHEQLAARGTRARKNGGGQPAMKDACVTCEHAGVCMPGTLYAPGEEDPAMSTIEYSLLEPPRSVPQLPLRQS